MGNGIGVGPWGLVRLDVGQLCRCSAVMARLVWGIDCCVQLGLGDDGRPCSNIFVLDRTAGTKLLLMSTKMLAQVPAVDGDSDNSVAALDFKIPEVRPATLCLVSMP